MSSWILRGARSRHRRNRTWHGLWVNASRMGGPTRHETLTGLRAAPALLLFSDYSGSHKGAGFDTYSFLITTPAALSSFLGARG